MPAPKKILLLSCCAPCSCAVIAKAAESGMKMTVVFYNPNIRPETEYLKRLEENKRVCGCYGIPFIELEYDNSRWCEAVRGLEDEPERGARCSVCFHLRLKRVMEYAKANGFDEVASVLGVSRYKDLAQVNRAAAKASAETMVPYKEVEGRKGGMQDRRAFLIRDLALYSQRYCGCPFSAAVSAAV